MTIDYKTSGTCSRNIHLTIEDGIVKDVAFEGGCHGNTQPGPQQWGAEDPGDGIPCHAFRHPGGLLEELRNRPDETFLLVAHNGICRIIHTYFVLLFR